MNIRPVNIINSYKNINFGISGFDKKVSENSAIIREAEQYRDTVSFALKRWEIDLPIMGNVTNSKGGSTNLMLNDDGNVIFAHVDKENNIDRVIAVADDGRQSTTKTYLFDKKTQKLKDYKIETNS